MRSIWTISAGILITAVVLLSHHWLPSQASNLATEIIRSLHGPGFGVVALLVLLIVRRIYGSTMAAYARAAVITVLLACLAEAAQIPSARAAQISDIFVDGLGIFGFLGAVALVDRSLRGVIVKWRRAVVSLTVVAALVATLTPTLRLCYAFAMRYQALPQVLGFDEGWEHAYSAGAGTPPEIIPAPAGWPDHSGKIARVRSAGRFGIMLHIYPHPDWSAYSAVSFVAASTNDKERRLAVGLWGIDPGDGSDPGRYYTQIKIGPRPQRYCVLFDDLNASNPPRTFDLTHVYELLLGATNAENGVEILVDDFRLETDGDNCSPGDSQS